MTIEIRTDGARATLILKGELTLDERTEDLHKAIELLLQQGFSEFLLDVGGLVNAPPTHRTATVAARKPTIW